MPSFNRIILVGHLTRDPELTYTPGAVAICKFGIAVNHKRKDRDGNTQEEVCFVDCTLFGKGGETFNQYMSKGKPALIEGRLKLDQWDDKQTGAKRSKHCILVDNFQFLGSREEGEQAGKEGTRPETSPAPADDDGDDVGI